jgi:hypothetical protein
MLTLAPRSIASELSSMSLKSKSCCSTKLIQLSTRTQGKYHCQYRRRICQAAVDIIREIALTKPAVHQFLPCVRRLLFSRAVRIYGIMSFADSRIILFVLFFWFLFLLLSESAKRSPITETILPMPPRRRRPRCTFRRSALHELSGLSLLQLSCYLQATRSRRCCE